MNEQDMTGIGVLTVDTLYHWMPEIGKGARHALVSPIHHLGDMYALGCEYKLHSLWLCPGHPLCQSYQEHPAEFAPDALNEQYKITVRTKEKSLLPTSATIATKQGSYGTRPLLRVFLPDCDPTWLEDLDERNGSWSLADIEDPRTFLQALILIHQKLGVHLDTSPAKTGIASMALHTQSSDWTHTPETLKLPHFAEKDMQWKRPLTANEQGLYLHRYDRNSMYLAACTGAEKGIGAPAHLSQEKAASAFSGGAMGLWECTVAQPSRWPILDGVDTARLPHNANWLGKDWLTTPGLKSYLAMGYECAIHQGYEWANVKGRKDSGKRRALKDWASHLYAIRQELKAKYGATHPAYKLIKMIANRSLGWLDLTAVADRIRAGCALSQVPWYFAPFFYQEIKGLARLRMVLKMQELARMGTYPVLIYTDCFAFLSSEPDARLAFPMLLQREQALGGFKHAGTHRVSEQVIAAFANDNAANITLQLLKRISQEG